MRWSLAIGAVGHCVFGMATRWRATLLCLATNRQHLLLRTCLKVPHTSCGVHLVVDQTGGKHQ
jgi:hypothetical protein